MRRFAAIFSILALASVASATAMQHWRAYRYAIQVSAEAHALCQQVTPRLQAGAAREVLEFLEAVFFAGDPHHRRAEVALIDHGQVVSQPEHFLEGSIVSRCDVPGRSDIDLAIVYPQFQRFGGGFIYAVFTAFVLLSVLYATAQALVRIAQRRVAVAFDEGLSRRLGLSPGPIVTTLGTASILDRFLLADSRIVHDTGRRIGELETEIGRKTEETARARSYEAIARMTQMLAHDVRQPFSTLKAAIMVLKSAQNDPARLSSLVDRLEQTLPRTVAKVEGLIADVMEIGSTARPRVEEVSIRGLLDEALEDVFPKGTPTGLSIEREDSSVTFCMVERRKILRAVVNILQNAKEALIGKSGAIRITTTQVRPDMFQLTISNTSSFIPPEAIPDIFESFFTAKRGGTGLGLAIAKKMTEAHGGSIRCESVEGVGVAFHLELPTI